MHNYVVTVSDMKKHQTIAYMYNDNESTETIKDNYTVELSSKYTCVDMNDSENKDCECIYYVMQ